MNDVVERLNIFRDATEYGLTLLTHGAYNDRELIVGVMTSLNDRLLMVENEVLTLKGLRAQAEEKDDE